MDKTKSLTKAIKKQAKTSFREFDVILATNTDIAFCFRFSQLRLASNRSCIFFVRSQYPDWQSYDVFKNAMDTTIVGAGWMPFEAKKCYFLPADGTLLIESSRLSVAQDENSGLLGNIETLVKQQSIVLCDLVVLKGLHIGATEIRSASKANRIWMEVDWNNSVQKDDRIQYISRPEIIHHLCQSIKARQAIQTTVRSEVIEPPQISSYTTLVKWLNANCDIQFDDFSQAWLAKKIDCRRQSIGLSHLLDYYDYFMSHETELKELEQLLFAAEPDPDWLLDIILQAAPLITVLKRTFPDSKADIRAWVVAAELGEAAYGLGLAWKQSQSIQTIEAHLKIFATDINRRNLEIAGSGLHISSVNALEAHGYLDKQSLVIKQTNGISLSQLRQMIVFGRHDIRQSAPYKNMHLIIAKNSLAPYQESIRHEILTAYCHSLYQGGILWLGPEDHHIMGGQAAQLGFERLSEGSPFYRKVQAPTKEAIQPLLGEKAVAHQHYVPPLSTLFRHHKRFNRYTNYHRVLDRLIDEFLYPGILFDTDFQLLHVLGEVKPFLLEFQSGRFCTDVRNLIKPPLSDKLPVLIEQVFDPGIRRHYKTEWSMNKHKPAQQLTVHILSEYNDHTQKKVGVLFFELKALESATENRLIELDHPMEAQSRYIQQLESELLQAQQVTSEVLLAQQQKKEETEAFNSELMYANEQIQNINQQLSCQFEALTTRFEQSNQSLKQWKCRFNHLPFGVAIIEKNAAMMYVNPFLYDYLIQQKLMDSATSLTEVGVDILKSEQLGAIYSELGEAFASNQVKQWPVKNVALIMTPLSDHELMLTLVDMALLARPKKDALINKGERADVG